MDVINNKGTEVALFSVLEQFPFDTFMSIVAICLIATFFITSADSATFVLGMQTTNGDLNPSGSIKLTWGLIQSLTAIILLWTGGLDALQTAAIIAALPFSIVLVLTFFSLMKAFKEEGALKREKKSV